MSDKNQINISKKRAELVIKTILLHNKNLIIEEPYLAETIAEYLKRENYDNLSIVVDDKIAENEEIFKKYQKIGSEYQKAKYEDHMANYNSELEESRHEPPLFFI